MSVTSPVNQALRTIVQDRVWPAEPMCRHTTLRVGGCADFLVRAHTAAELRRLLAVVQEYDLPLAILGNGSNLIVSDSGVRGVVLALGGDFAAVSTEGARVRAGAGVHLPRLAAEVSRQGLAGLEFACGVPGTLGAGLIMNAGAHGADLAQVVVAAEVMWPDGSVERLERRRLDLGYRRSGLMGSGAVVLAATLELTPDAPAATGARVRAYLEHRKQTQPLHLPNCGSVFMNPPGDHAGRLLQAAGCKGLREGDAQIAAKHANFVVNLGRARATDVLFLMTQARQRVQEQFGVRLVPEVKIWGDAYPFEL